MATTRSNSSSDGSGHISSNNSEGQSHNNHIRTRSRRSRNVWTPSEDALLRSLVDQYGDARGQQSKWKTLAEKVPGRTAKDCRKRWFHSLDPSLRKGRWTAEEDQTLLHAYAQLGPAWHIIASMISGRKDDQCAKRYNEILNPSVQNRLSRWSEEEDRILGNGVRCLGHQWSAISQRLPGRPPLTCRNRWRALSGKRGVPRDAAEKTAKQISVAEATNTPAETASPDTTTDTSPYGATSPVMANRNEGHPETSRSNCNGNGNGNGNPSLHATSGTSDSVNLVSLLGSPYDADALESWWDSSLFSDDNSSTTNNNNNNNNGSNSSWHAWGVPAVSVSSAVIQQDPSAGNIPYVAAAAPPYTTPTAEAIPVPNVPNGAAATSAPLQQQHPPESQQPQQPPQAQQEAPPPQPPPPEYWSGMYGAPSASTDPPLGRQLLPPPRDRDRCMARRNLPAQVSASTQRMTSNIVVAPNGDHHIYHHYHHYYHYHYHHHYHDEAGV